MLPLRHSRRWQIASVALLVVVMLAALMPAIWFWRDLAAEFRAFDKYLHAASFLLLALWFSGQYRPQSYWRIALGLIAFGALIEICQRMVGYRTSEWNDLLANVVGIASGLMIAVAGAGGWSLRFENWLRARADSS